MQREAQCIKSLRFSQPAVFVVLFTVSSIEAIPFIPKAILIAYLETTDELKGLAVKLTLGTNLQRSNIVLQVRHLSNKFEIHILAHKSGLAITAHGKDR